MHTNADPPLVAIRGILLRSVLLLELDRASPATLTVADLCAALRRHGFTVEGRASKVVSDSLRTSMARGRVFRPARGHYRLLYLPRTTRWRCRQRVLAALAGTAPPHYYARGIAPVLDAGFRDATAATPAHGDGGAAMDQPVEAAFAPAGNGPARAGHPAEHSSRPPTAQPRPPRDATLLPE